MKILLCGALGKMGRTLAQIVSEREDCEIVAGVDVHAGDAAFPLYLSPAQVKEDADVLIDFSHPSALGGILEYAAARNMPVVLATTGYASEQITLIRKAAERIPVFFTANMSLGVNLLSELAKTAARVLGTSYDIEILEMHHNRKIDAPSGTALMLADEIASVLPEEPVYVFDRHAVRARRGKREIGIQSIRGGTIVGEHEILFCGTDEVVKLSHSAGSKAVFASGAVNAAAFMVGKPAGLYSMHDLVKE
ncbi:MAG: 4-hydroxy-tetrahydrodipicolinate reductase [Clostridia bacterium]|nr:4-hydroxy-tetrahydrodipicolinate reductase [Clostridia bacterium]